MECPIGAGGMSGMSALSGRPGSPGERVPDANARSLPCVWSGDTANGCSCRSSIPEDVVTVAWRHELERAGEHADRFFHFTWQNDVWLAYGLMDGRVRGVHCPPHRVEREERAFLADSRVDERPDEFALYA
jgi:hypothetical protein